MDGFVSKADFAKIYGCSRPYISQLVKDKRLVLSEDGKRVNVEASLRMLDVSADPSKAGVRERWSAYREGKPFAGLATGTSGSEEGAGSAPPEQLPLAAASVAREPNKYHDARTLREQAQAEMAQLELARATGRALDADTTLKAIADAHASTRIELMMMADRLTPLVAPTSDPKKVYDLIRGECVRMCERMQAKALELASSRVTT